MWRNNINSVSGMLKNKPLGGKLAQQPESFITYPQVNRKQKMKIWLSKKTKQVIPIFTPLIVLTNFYI